MAEKLEIAPWGPTRLEVYVACRALKQGVPRVEVKRLKREKLINGTGQLTPAGDAQIGRLRQLRKEGLVEEKPKLPTLVNQVVPNRRRERNYPGIGSRKQRRFNKKAERINGERAAKALAAAIARNPRPDPVPQPKLFESAYA